MASNVMRIILVIVFFGSMRILMDLLIDVLYDSIKDLKKSYNEIKDHTE